jgi:predicted CXXCH cytochrome family protein
MRHRTLQAILATVLGMSLHPAALSAQSDFPHERHSVFFSECTACHAGIQEAGEAGIFPESTTCATCHDGATAPTISWRAPGPRQSSLSFNHPSHVFGCETCHLPEGPEDLAALSMPEPETCLGCHASGTTHEQAEDCGLCHRVVEDLSPTRPDAEPPFHGEGFAASHGAAASLGQPDCTGCHSESTCISCHEGPGSPVFHPVNFLSSHGPEAYGRVSDCRSCHSTEAFCRECHSGLGFGGGGGGVAPFHNDQPVWVLSHPQAARQDLESCVSCHQQTDCLSCHSARAGWGISPHGPGFEASSVGDRNNTSCGLCHITSPLGGGD